ncbi:MAG: DNA (cytosine-5-)-methyltransferase [Candidatus Yanofskybacteria bacterium RIFCSPLOWO2_02_FULL_43_10]|uniref:Cytosine-specific methyltransferase n=1 Tax=Candidatus Yanofskybacteria bacterium RIFCSPLOWO2_12_FULL_43_11b TaxID=1802710 RepID=A0A1F8H9V1_9BACT|nr:MAG: DNA (cytosine-5-)-methyltransferase [Candidatus Yanofskybacteria bacterium RIFCSPHIGHO2_01_FULL_43_32]OGN12055.1 MAG: DNA (cytosine-5-)-methyltransferase [Candidatus Yanofskybacteria bacterium RIFCSPHIGHO2_02_FULL_43_12]OGN17570.1 MAG: DNA (cytosine-5-)-methyltransferase [Candidatus Yanofskybacteria bacterium RIFCSPHIGHO2_12_FULL_43_11]OGN25075.1 MAG: DNA (cytosine-5-)-methyltransferase [Candidatus Yanofskybacteria bacterium RIFCSPLOWO2_01_FULL_43_46]OGN28730.1 MAG: DNA (cytosine-5-)-me
MEDSLNNHPTYVDLFSGAGGFSLGFDNNGFINIFSVDMEPSFCETYSKNFPGHRLIQKDITNLTKQEVLSLIKGKRIDVVIGGPPCQGFSMAGNIGRKFVDDSRNSLLMEFARMVEIIKPSYFIMENVARLYNHNKGNTREEIVKKFIKSGYKVDCRILNSADYGVPQIRKRIIFVGSRVGGKILFPEREVERYITTEEALREFTSKDLNKDSNIYNHETMKHSGQMLKKMSYVSDGGNRFEIPSHIRPKSGDVRKYIRYNSNKPSICVTGDMRKVFHYSENRALTVRELAKLQSFPNDFIFVGSRISQQQQVGNAVPPLMASAIARVVKKMIKNDK